jgi:hypothetical protein
MKTYICLLFAALVLTGVAGAEDAVFPNRLRNAVVGEWAILMDTAGPEIGNRERVVVVDVAGDGDEKAVVIRREPIDDDGTVGEGGEVEINLARFADRMREMTDKAKEIESVEMLVGDSELTMWSMMWEKEAEDGQTYEYKVWVSEELPVGGLFKTWSSDPEFSAVEMIDCGN